MNKRTGVWVIGALGGLATTVIAGARAIGRGVSTLQGMSTVGDGFDRLGLVSPADLEFGGHDVRRVGLRASAEQIHEENGSITRSMLDAVGDDLASIGDRIRPGSTINGGRAIAQLVEDGATLQPSLALHEIVATIQEDIRRFRVDLDLDLVIVVNLASTEPLLEWTDDHRTARGLGRILDDGAVEHVRPSLLYAYAAVSLGCPYINFTPSNAALTPGLAEFAASQHVPFMGSDGKTGETLVKTALAPLFRDRGLRVLTWQGYNILGDRDGQVLADPENLRSKVGSKDQALPHILGYPLHTHVGIDYVPSLRDLKTAWDFIHFEGFLGFRMSMQFTWQGCDSVLAAPIVLDLIRMAELAARRGEHGSMPHLASFFKSPYGVDEHDFHRQWKMLVDYVETVS